MADSLTGPFVVAATLLAIAGGAKLRAPATASRALTDAGLPSGHSLVRAFAASELALTPKRGLSCCACGLGVRDRSRPLSGPPGNRLGGDRPAQLPTEQQAPRRLRRVLL